MEKNDFVLIGALLLLCGIGAIFFFTHTDKEMRHAVITQDNVQLYDIPLVCVKTGKASKKGDVIACLPHKLLIEVK